jgi:hypothetical protein
MKRLFLIAVLSLLAACTTVSLTPNSQIQTAAETVSAYVRATEIALMRGRITPDQAAKASANAKKARDSIVAARVALAGCKPDTPCTDYVSLIQQLQPTLYELERELRAQEARK